MEDRFLHAGVHYVVLPEHSTDDANVFFAMTVQPALTSVKNQMMTNAGFRFDRARGGWFRPDASDVSVDK